MRFGADGSGMAGQATKDRILEGALALFNAEGACGASAVDIASALNISPGHLYYHFKGKPELIAALFDIYEDELALVLEAALADVARPEAGIDVMAVHVHILLEESDDVRFLFREAGALTALLPLLAPRYARVFAAFDGAAAHMLSALAAKGAIKASGEALAGLARAIALGLAFKLTQLDLEGDASKAKKRLARAAAEIMAPVFALA